MSSFIGKLFLNHGMVHEKSEQKQVGQKGFVIKKMGNLYSYDDGLFQVKHEINKGILITKGRYLVIFDGKIYNEKQLRCSLEKKGYTFESISEIETIARMFENCGLQAFKELRGIFSIVIWDIQDKILYAARDTFGMKPLYIMETDEKMYVAFGRKAITELNSDLKFNEQALQHYFSFQYVPTPMTLAKEIICLEPGHFLVKYPNKPIKKHRYFHATFQSVDGNEKQMINRIQEVLMDSIKNHIQQEEKVGAFLSGGIDSSLIVGIAKEIHPSIKTFSVGFNEEGFSEIPIAQETAAKLGVENLSYLISPTEYVESLETIVTLLDDPLADPSCVPLYFAAREASNHVKVVLSGEGADELFGGYNIYREYDSLKLFNRLPPSMLHWLNKLSRIIPEGTVGKSFIERGTTPLKDRYIGNAKIFEEKEKQRFLKMYDEANSYRFITEELFRQMEDEHPSHQMQYIDIHTWLPGNILLKADRMTKGHSISLRTPFLDKEVFQVARKIPVKYKILDKQTKVILRKAAQAFVPEHVVERKKLGFPVPIRLWLRNELYDWALQSILISETDHLLEKSYCLKLLAEHASGRKDNSRKLWTVLMFMLWYRQNAEAKSCMS